MSLYAVSLQLMSTQFIQIIIIIISLLQQRTTQTYTRPLLFDRDLVCRRIVRQAAWAWENEC